MRLALRILLVTILLTLVRVGLAAITSLKFPGLAYCGWLVLANLVIASILFALADRSCWRAGRLAAGLFVVAFGVGSVGTLIEAVLFRLFPVVIVGGLALSALLVCGLAARSGLVG